MENIIVKSDSNLGLKEFLVKIDNDEIPAVDIPYFIQFNCVDSEKFTGDFIFVNNRENVKSFQDRFVKFNFGERSGKVYKVEFSKGAFLNSDRIRFIKKELLVKHFDNRYKNNISVGLSIIKDLFELIEKNQLCPTSGHKT